MKLEFRGDGPVDIVVVDADRIDAAGAVQFKDAFKASTIEGTRAVVLDMSLVDFIDSSGLGAIVAAQKLLGADRELELANLKGAVAKVMSLTRMDTVFRIHADVAAAEAVHQSSAA